MRLITTVVIASVVGSVAIGGVKSYLGRDRTSSVQKMAELLRKDRKTTIRRIEQATFDCMPGLARIQNKKTRTLLSRVIVFSISVAGDKRKRDEHLALVIKELQPVLANASEQDMALLAKAVDQTKDEKSKSVACIIQATIKSAESNPKPLLSDAKLRGT
jgi:hypothetical protein